MKFIFIVQGEGKGHYTQALALEEMLQRNGHEVVEILVGRFGSAALPGFFNRNVRAAVKRFVAPDCQPPVRRTGSSGISSFLKGIRQTPEYLHSMRYIRRRIRQTGADVVINFYELLTGLVYAYARPDVPCVCVGPQYLFLHRDVELPRQNSWEHRMLQVITRLTASGASRLLAFSFREMVADDSQRITVVPPLLRREIRLLETKEEDFLHGYLIAPHFMDHIRSLHRKAGHVDIHVFMDHREVREAQKQEDRLCLHTIDDHTYLDYLAACRACIGTLGFDSICEAMYLNKPVLLSPGHVAQQGYAHLAVEAGAGQLMQEDKQDPLKECIAAYRPDPQFREWVRSGEMHVIRELERVAAAYKNTTMRSLTNYIPI